MPFEKRFWDAPRHIASAAGALEQVKGFITALPVMWIKGENNRFEYPTALVADNDVPAIGPTSAPVSQQADAGGKSPTTSSVV